MTPLVWANLPLGLLFVLGIVGIPLWMTFKRPQTPPDHSEARAYLRAKESLASDSARPAGPATARRHASADRITVPGRRHSEAAPEHAHRAGDAQHAGAAR